MVCPWMNRPSRRRRPTLIALVLLLVALVPAVGQARYSIHNGNDATQTAVIKGDEFNTCATRISGDAGWSIFDVPPNPLPDEATGPVRYEVFRFAPGENPSTYQYVADLADPARDRFVIFGDDGTTVVKEAPQVALFATANRVLLATPIETSVTGVFVYTSIPFSIAIPPGAPLGSTFGMKPLGGATLRNLRVVDCSSTVAVTVTGSGSGTVGSAPAGISCPGTCSATLPDGTVTLTATPDVGSTFTRWQGACASATTPTCTVTIDGTGDLAATAEFSRSAPVITKVVPRSIARGAARVVHVHGSSFVPGSTVVVGGTGVTVTGVRFVSSTDLEVSLTAARSARRGRRTITVTAPGGASANCVGCLRVTGRPKITAVAPANAVVGSTRVVQLTGQNFRQGIVARISGNGVRVIATRWVGASIVRLTLQVGSGAKLGKRHVTLKNPDGGAATCVGCFTVKAVTA